MCVPAIPLRFPVSSCRAFSLEPRWLSSHRYPSPVVAWILHRYAWDSFSSLFFSHPEAIQTATEVAHAAHSHGSALLLSNSKLLDSIGVGILVSSIGLKEWLFQSTMKIARKTDSSVLKANAWHHRVDALTAVVALVGLSGRVLDGWFLET